MSKNKISGAVLASVSRVWQQIVGLGLIILVISYISPRIFGEFVIASAVYGSVSIFIGNGLSEYILKKDNENISPPVCLIINILIATILCSILFILSLYIDEYFGTSSAGILLQVILPIYFVQALSSVLEPILLRNNRLGYVSISLIGADTLGLLSALIALWLGFGGFALVAHKWFRELAFCGTLLGGKRWKPRFVFDRSVAKDCIKFAAGIISGRFVAHIMAFAGDLIVGFFLGPAVSGLYRLANKVVLSFTSITTFALQKVLWINLPDLRNNKGMLRETAMSNYRTAAIINFALVAGVASISWIAFPVFLSADWQPAIPLVGLLAIARLVAFPYHLCEPVLALHNRTDILFYFSVVWSVSRLALLTAMTPYGLLYAGFSEIIASLVPATVSYALLSRYGIAPINRMLDIFIRLVACSGVMAAAVICSGQFLAAVGFPSVIALAFTILLGAGIYIPLAYWLFPSTARELQLIVFSSGKFWRGAG